MGLGFKDPVEFGHVLSNFACRPKNFASWLSVSVSNKQITTYAIGLRPATLSSEVV